MSAVLAELPERDLRAALRALQSIAEASASSMAFVGTALDQLTSIVPSDLTTLSICDLAQGTRRVIGRKGEKLSDADRAAFDRHFREHPLVRFHGSHPGGPTQRISDCMSATAFRHSALHADYYRRIRIDHVMALPLRIDDANVISVVFNRSGSDFRDAERALADAVRRPLAAIYRNLIACESAGSGLRSISELAAKGGWHMMRVTLAGRVLDAAPGAMRLLARFFADGAGATLPAALLACLARSHNWGLDRSAVAHAHPFTLSRLGTRLTVHFVPDRDATGYLLMRCDRLTVGAGDLSGLPVTEREREVLALVAGGKTNGEIAAVLAISARTVQKHLEHIFQKLGVETRTAAAVSALAAVDARAAGPP